MANKNSTTTKKKQQQQNENKMKAMFLNGRKKELASWIWNNGEHTKKQICKQKERKM